MKHPGAYSGGMKLVLFGATGAAGRDLVAMALQAGHEVTAVARNPAAVELKHERLRVVKGDVTSADSVSDAIAGCEGVISAIGPRPGTPPGTLISDATRFILAGLARHGGRRFVLTSGLMAGGKGLGVFQRIGVAFFRAMNRALYEDKLVAEKLVMASDLDWSIVRPPLFGVAPARGTYRIAEDLDASFTKMSSADVAKSLLDVLADAKWRKKAVEISV